MQELCRGKIRHRLRQNIWYEHSDLETKKPILPVHQRQTARQHTLRRFVIPIFEESDEALSDDEQDIVGRARFLLNVDAHPGEAITTTLQLVRAVIQPNQNDSEENQRVSSNMNENTRDAITTRSFQERQQRWKSDAMNFSSSTEGTSTDNTSSTSTGPTSSASADHTSSASADHNFSTSADHTSSTSADVNDNNNEERSERDGEKSTTSYSNMSESDSDAEQENAFIQRKKIAKCEKTDSGIVEDMNLNNEEGSSSSNTNHSDSDMTDTTDTGDAMDIDLPDIAVYKSYRNHTCGSRSKDSASRKKATIAHYVDSNAFAVYMREKIQQLPLPFSIKLYINYNRKL